MAQASSVQREPSMEEILASIRRIIEDNESGRKDIQGDSSAEDESSAEFQSFRPELTPANLPQSSPAATDNDKAEEPPVPRTLDENRDTSGKDTEFVSEDSLPEEKLSDPSIDAHAHKGTATPPAGEASVHPPAFERDRQDIDPPSLRALEPASVSLNTERRPIVSEVPGRKVAAAFDELNEALLEMRRKSLDQMVDELLQPMLQDWLDNNLPQLVERLVREEIERIARG